MRVLITGATGFLGAAIARDMLTRSEAVAVLTRRAVAGTRLALVADGLSVIEGDVLAPESYREHVMAFAPEAVVHCAWWGVDGASRNDPRQLDNLSATGALVAIAADAGARVFVGIGSQAEYGPCEGPTSETSPAKPTTLYGITKVAAGQALAQMATERGLRNVWARVYSLYGPDDDGPWLIPSMIRAFQAGHAPKVTPCEQRWDFLHVADAARAVAALVACELAQGTFNIGSGRAVPLRAVILGLRDLIAPGVEPLFGAIPYRDDQVMHLEADIARLQTLTGWAPRIELGVGLKETVAAVLARGATA